MYLNGLLKTTSQYLMSDERTEVPVWRERRDIFLLSALILGAIAGTRNLLPLATLPEARLEITINSIYQQQQRVIYKHGDDLRFYHFFAKIELCCQQNCCFVDSNYASCLRVLSPEHSIKLAQFGRPKIFDIVASTPIN